MARQDAMLRLHQRLLAQRDSLRAKLANDIKIARSSGAGTSDMGDVAADDAEHEINSQIAALETRELQKIEKAIEAIREGRYGLCELCARPIPIERLRALPYTSSCVACQRRQEERGLGRNRDEADWESAFEFQSRSTETELRLKDIVVEE
jgi:DnaK suppressor protein